MEPRRGRSRQAGPGPRLGRRPGRLAEQLFGQLSLLPSPHTHLGLSAGPLTLTSRTHPQASPSFLRVQATSRGLLHQPPCCLWALWLQPSRLTAPSPHSRWTEPALLRLSLPGMKPGLWGPTHLRPTDLLISTELTPLSSHRPFWSSNSPSQSCSWYLHTVLLSPGSMHPQITQPAPSPHGPPAQTPFSPCLP